MEAQGYDLTTTFNLVSMQWMLTKDIDKDAYFAAKITDREEILKEYPDLIELYRKGGFIFFMRKMQAITGVNNYQETATINKP